LIHKEKFDIPRQIAEYNFLNRVNVREV
jgi:hypothetical protein